MQTMLPMLLLPPWEVVRSPPPLLAVLVAPLLAARGVVSGSMTLGDLVLVNAFLLQLFIPLNFLGIVYSQLKHALTDMQLMLDVLKREPEITDQPALPAGRGGPGGRCSRATAGSSGRSRW